jgi:putative Ca2+/H+ antiporter (TMEM165/GDT1 family)
LGVILGRTLLLRLPIRLLHKLSGGVFLALSALAWFSVDWRALWQLAQSLAG